MKCKKGLPFICLIILVFDIAGVCASGPTNDVICNENGNHSEPSCISLDWENNFKSIISLKFLELVIL